MADPREKPDYTIVSGARSNCPIMLLPNNRYAYLRTWADRKAGKIIKQAGLRTNQRYKGTLTDEEEALAMRLILEHG
jgi:hypothetical protein